METTADTDDFARNLQWLCAQERSVSEICRRVGVNRQQFARYLNGSARPSPHNLARICRFFGVERADLSLPHRQFIRETATPELRSGRGPDTLTTVFPGDRVELRGWTGRYHAHYRSPSQPDRVIRAYVEVIERDGLFETHTLERTRHPETGSISRARYVGLVAMRGETLFLVERGRRAARDVSETILNPAHRSSRRWLTGLLLAYSWRIGRPYVSRCVWKRLPETARLRDLLARCGAFPVDSRDLDGFVLAQLAGDMEDGAAPMPVE